MAMNLRKLYHTIETIGSQRFESEELLLTYVLQEIVGHEHIDFKGGRLWKLVVKSGMYELVHQIGSTEHITLGHRIQVKDYPILLELPRLHTVIAEEDNQFFRDRGIHMYSVTGIGEKVDWQGHALYKYIVAFNADEIGQDTKARLNIIGAALNALLRSQKVERKASVLEMDLDQASEIQRRILPQHAMQFHSYEMYGVSVADRIVGGDFFDYLQVEGDTERLGVVIGDATAKGMSAAVEALYVSGALRLGYQYQSRIGVLLSHVNKLFHKTFADDHFISLFYAELTDSINGLMFYANCGHNNPILLRAGSIQPEFLEATGQVLGPFPEESFKTDSVRLGPGDILLLYTDGITEASNLQGDLYGEERLVQHLIEGRALSPKDLTQHLLNDVQSFSTLGSYSDDRTLIVILRKP